MTQLPQKDDPNTDTPQSSEERLRAEILDIFRWLNDEDREPYDGSVPNAIDRILAAVKVELGAAIGEDEKTLTTRPVMHGSVDPSPTGTLDELNYTEKQRNRNELRQELRNHFGIEEIQQ